MELGTALALVAFADQCIRYGQKLVKRCKNYRRAQEGARELLVSIEYNWVKMELKIQFLRGLAENLDPIYLALQSHILSLLEGKLKSANLTIDQLIHTEKRIEGHEENDLVARIKSLTAMGPGKKTRYAFRREALEAIVDDLEKWQERFDPTWMLMMRMEYQAIDEKLIAESQKPRSDQSSFIMSAKAMRDTAKLSMEQLLPAQQKVWLDANAFNSIDLNSTSTSPTLLSITHFKDSGDQVIVDTVHCNPIADITRTTKEVCNLARILSKVDPTTFGLLKCRGIIKGSETITDKLGSPKELPTFTFVFDISPELSNPRSLRNILQTATPYALNERFELARQLTHSILYVHTARFVHKNIRPETIVVFENEKSKIGASFLLGFEKFRQDDGQTYWAGDGLWEQNLYRHPTRQGILPEETYKMQHDIYSIGVILLEIGLWTSFVDYKCSTPETPETTKAVPTETLLHLPAGEEKDQRKQAFRNMEMLEDLAERELPIKMGQKYTDVVLSCLRCLDEGDNGGRAEFLDEDGNIVGERFVGSILGKIQEISF